MPIAEQTGLIGPLTSFVLETALRQLGEWTEQGEELSVAVNLSARSFLDAELAVELPLLLERTGVEAERLELEITESMLMLDPARAQAMLERLSAIGLRLSVDDFGTGYSSLANLKRLPVDVIKIDKSFVIDMPHDAVRRGDRALHHRARATTSAWWSWPRGSSHTRRGGGWRSWAATSRRATTSRARCPPRR